MYNKSKVYDLLNVFQEKFQEGYSEYKRKGKRKFLLYSNCVFFRWYYSALISESILSPANIISQFQGDSKNSISVPILKPKSLQTFKGFEFKFLEYSVSEHPILNDIKILLREAKPRIFIDKDGFLVEEEANKILDKITFFDPFYLRYLISLASQLKLLKEMPSIYSVVYYVSENADDFFNDESRVLLKKVFDAAVMLAVYELRVFIPSDINIFSTEYVLSVVTSRCSIDKVIKDVYDVVGIDFEYITDLDFSEENNYNDIDEAVWFGTYYLGIVLERWIFTPFSRYFGFLNPLYLSEKVFPDAFELMEAEVIKSQDFEYPSFAYTPANIYSLTSVGCDFFGLKFSDEYAEMFSVMDINVLTDMVIKNLNNAKKSEFKVFEEAFNVYEIKVKFMDNKYYWKVFEIKDTVSLDWLHRYICREFFINPLSEYSFYTDESLSEFKRYTPKKNFKRNSKKTEKTPLSQILSNENNKIFYKSENSEYIFSDDFGEDVFISIELLKIKEKSENSVYPQIIRRSSYAKSMEEPIEF